MNHKLMIVIAAVTFGVASFFFCMLPVRNKTEVVNDLVVEIADSEETQTAPPPPETGGSRAEMKNPPNVQPKCAMKAPAIKPRIGGRGKGAVDDLLVGFGGSQGFSLKRKGTLAMSSAKCVQDHTRRINFNTEAYDRMYENEFRNALENPLSTFSIDVDAASYSNVRRFLNQNQWPYADAVRVEEFINYFNYDYPDPDGKHPFSITAEVSNCPWNTEHALVHIGLQGKKVKVDKLPPSNLVFLLDVSGSMNYPNKLPLLKKSFRLLIQQLREEDKVSIVVYAGSSGLVLPATRGDNKEKILNALDQLQAGGSTAGGAGIKLAYKIAKGNLLTKGNNRVILATDGDFNVGVSSDGELVRLIEKKREQGIFLTVLGFGMGNYKDSKMEKLADKGNGNYAYIDNILEAKKVLVKEMGGTLLTIAKDVKIQVEFNPARVKSYRLIGYENRILAKEDFDDDKKDAGELGAGHTVTALYELELGKAEPKIPLKYQDNKVSERAKESPELLTVKFRYKKPDGHTSKLIQKQVMDKVVEMDRTSDNYRFSAAVAGFGMLLRDSKHKGTVTFKKVIKLAKGAKGQDPEGYRAEFIKLAEVAEMLKPRVSQTD